MSNTKVRIDHDSGNGGTVQVKHEMDMQPTLDAARLSRERTRGQKMGDLVHLVSLPLTVVLEIHKQYRLGRLVGGTIKFDSDEKKRLIKVIQQDYPHLMMTEGKFA